MLSAVEARRLRAYPVEAVLAYIERHILDAIVELDGPSQVTVSLNLGDQVAQDVVNALYAEGYTIDVAELKLNIGSVFNLTVIWGTKANITPTLLASSTISYQPPAPGSDGRAVPTGRSVPQVKE